jgi:uncharacterized protein YcfJ
MDRSLLLGLAAGIGATVAVGTVADYALRTPAAPAASATLESAPLVPGASGPLDSAPLVPAASTVPGRRWTGAPAAMPAVYRAPARYASVLDVRPVTRTVQEPRQVCRDEPVVQQAPVRDEQRVLGTLAGAAIGGLLGNQVGSGDGRKLATIAGTVAGGYAGNRIQDRVQRTNTVTTTEQRCETVYDTREEALGYDVTYQFDGRVQTVRMDEAPAERLPVRDGQVILTASTR